MHWIKFLESFLVQISHSRKTLLNITDSEELDANNSTVGVLLFIPFVGLLASILIFIIIDMRMNQMAHFWNLFLKTRRFLDRIARDESVVSFAENGMRRNRLIQAVLDLLRELT